MDTVCFPLGATCCTVGIICSHLYGFQFHYQNNSYTGQILKLFVKFFPSSCYFPSLRSKHHPQLPVFKHVFVCSPLTVISSSSSSSKLSEGFHDGYLDQYCSIVSPHQFMRLRD
jgi:hypothetical protein